MGSPIYGGRVPYYEGLLQKKFCDTFAFYTINDMLLTKSVYTVIRESVLK